MSNLKDQLIKLGSKRKDLRLHIRPVLAELNKEARGINFDATSITDAAEDLANKHGLSFDRRKSYGMASPAGIFITLSFRGTSSELEGIENFLPDANRSFPAWDVEVTDSDARGFDLSLGNKK